MSDFTARLKKLVADHKAFVAQPNEIDEGWYNGIYDRYKRPAITREHVPPHWRFDFDEKSNPQLQERLGINCAFNAGAIKKDGVYYMVVRTEGLDRKSFFALASSPNGIDNWSFQGEPLKIPQLERWDTNAYDMRLTAHEDGYIYGCYCSERKDPNAPAGDTSAAEAQAPSCVPRI